MSVINMIRRDSISNYNSTGSHLLNGIPSHLANGILSHLLNGIPSHLPRIAILSSGGFRTSVAFLFV